MFSPEQFDWAMVALIDSVTQTEKHSMTWRNLDEPRINQPPLGSTL
jgi:hypothetical protein